MFAGSTLMQAAPKRHLTVFGKATTVKLFLGTDDSKSEFIKVRPLYVDGRLKEFTTGEIHDITEQQVAVQRAYRVNDSLPEDPRSLPKWRWQRGNWLLLDRSTGRLTSLRLPDFDAFYSEVTWYRDYAAYCGISEAGDKLYAVVAQLGERKPIVLTLLRPVSGAEPQSACTPPRWQRTPVRVTFPLKDGHQVTFTVHGRTVDVSPEPVPPGKDETD